MGCSHSTERDASEVASAHNVPFPIAVQGSPNSSRPNVPLRLPRTIDAGTDAPQTRSALEQERRAFFHTRVDGRPEIWQAIELAAQMVRDDQDLTSAQGVLDAAGLTLPRGYMEDAMWDEQGHLYRIENWIVADPPDLIEDEGRDDGVESSKDQYLPGNKGKGLAPTPVATGPPLQIRVRLSDRGTDIICTIGKGQSVRTLEELVRETAIISSSAKIRFAYLGRILKPMASIESQGWQEGHIISALVSPSA